MTIKKLVLLCLLVFLSACSGMKSHFDTYEMTISISASPDDSKSFSPHVISELMYQRLIFYGVAKKAISIASNNCCVAIELTGITDTTPLINITKSQGVTEVREIYSNSEFYKFLQRINVTLRRIAEGDSLDHNDANQETNPLGGGIPIDTDSSYSTDSSDQNDRNSNPLFEKLCPAIGIVERSAGTATIQIADLSGGTEIGYCCKEDTAEVLKVLAKEKAVQLLPPHTRFCWSAATTSDSIVQNLIIFHQQQGILNIISNGMIINPSKHWKDHGEIYALYAINNDTVATRHLSDQYIASAKVVSINEDKYEINLTLNDHGKLEYYLLSRRNIGKYLAIITDNRVIATPQIFNAEKNGRLNLETGLNRESETEFCDLIQFPAAFSYVTTIKVH